MRKECTAVKSVAYALRASLVKLLVFTELVIIYKYIYRGPYKYYSTKVRPVVKKHNSRSNNIT